MQRQNKKLIFSHSSQIIMVFIALIIWYDHNRDMPSTTASTDPLSNPRQADLFEPLLQAYRQAGEEGAGVANADLYKTLGLQADKAPVGQAGVRHNLAHRQVRWQQQTLRQLGLLQRVPGKRGAWRLTPKKELTPATPGVKLVAFSTHLGLGLWARCEDVFPHINEPIHLILTSPPYPLQKARAYGGPSETEFVDFICRALEPLVKNLVPGGSVALNIANDIFLPKSPARSLYVERTVIALHERLRLSLMDRLIWENPCKPPGPTWWACRERVQLVGTYEPVLWFCADPLACFADNRRVLQPHSAQHQALMARGGENRNAVHGDGAFTLRPGSFANTTAGRIPRNIMKFPNGGGARAARRKEVAAAGFPVHGAPMPAAMARFLIEFLTQPGHLVADLFSGDFTTAKQAEEAGRRWIGTEMMGEFAAAASIQFKDAKGFETHFSMTPQQD